ncbi:glucose-induced degradation complex subunit FYV10 KNAG_0A05290 [Huiozyma naganishii CBS 8797]|uniref:Uncharacterized protein n=1 Tax=Huiozyma naganishii (strain ATCC MYA-139 / BCRC 22969 / CBS 8797 / KCTC 17520 / NBRC 10181 / NCYC 3082 / Yp74L-3) TaxID=1071383 RepID=J7R068_HUIN7|nr:hypothetical protein KNAG_0A05290 [Kazachstania naganishii CBS 8797]CCK68195.1 hypothetical protein KNAG_0A05290 [Kazachstania naganishii CBS 8797]
MQLINEPDTDFHLKLNEQLFHIPYVMLQRNYKRWNECLHTEESLLADELAQFNALMNYKDLNNDKQAVSVLTKLIKRIDAFEKRIEKIATHEMELLDRIDHRIKFFKLLQQTKTENDRSGLLQWYQQYTNLLICDYLTRNSPLPQNNEMNPGESFLLQHHLDKLLDHRVLVNANKISKELTEHHDLTALLNWVKENNAHLGQRHSQLEFKARFQEYIDVLKSGHHAKAIECLQSHLLKFMSSNSKEIQTACGLIVYIDTCAELLRTDEQQDNSSADLSKEYLHRFTTHVSKNKSAAYQHFFRCDSPFESQSSFAKTSLNSLDTMASFFNSTNLSEYMDLLKEERWQQLNELFLDEYYSLYGISKDDPLLIYLSLGISTLKTHACLEHIGDSSGSHSILDTTLHQQEHLNPCPVCSENFAPLAKDLPYAHHTESKLFDNPVMLPNGNVYDLKKLEQLAQKLRRKKIFPLQEYEILDPIDKEVYSKSDYITMYPT